MGCHAPFVFFTSHPEEEIWHAVPVGRLREFEAMGWDPQAVLDPQGPATFRACALGWTSSRSPEAGDVA